MLPKEALTNFNDYRPIGNIKALKSNAEFNKQSGINELKKQVKLLDKFISKLANFKNIDVRIYQKRSDWKK